MSPRSRTEPPAAGAEPSGRLTVSEVARSLLAAQTGTPRDRSSVTLTRNARGATQIEVKVRTGELGVETVEQAVERARELYDGLRTAYPEPEQDGGG